MRFSAILLAVAIPACGNPELVSQNGAIPRVVDDSNDTQPTESAFWPDWRGPSADGRSDATNLPATWTETENIQWKTSIHDIGHSTPVIFGDQIWLTTASEEGTALFAVCVNLTSGKIESDIELFNPKDLQRNHVRNSFATPSPVIEEGRVYIHFGTYGTACIDTSNRKVLWSRNDLNCNHFQGPVSSPVLYRDLLILNFQGFDSQYIVALDKKTGKTIWRKDRPSEIYSNLPKGSFPQSYETPVLLELEGKTQLIVNSSKVATGHNPENGEEIWRFLYSADNTTSRIVSGLGLLFVNHGVEENGKLVLSALREGGTGDITNSHEVWRVTESAPFLSSPVLVDDLLYTVNNRGDLYCLDANSGEVIWSERLTGKFGPSLLYADGRIYVSNQRGTTTVIVPGRSYQELATNKIDGAMSASPVVAGSSLLLRTEKNLYRIANEGVF